MATLTQLGVRLQDVTGRRNLSLDSDLCARVINRACRFADALQDHPQTSRREFFKPAADASTTTIADLRSVDSIHVSDGTQRGALAFMDYEDAKAEGLIGVDTQLVAGTPQVYTIYAAGLSPNQYTLTSTDFTNAGYDSAAWEDVQFALSYGSLALLWLPPSDGSWTFDLRGKFWSATLSATVTTNWWSVNQPDTIVYLAAMFLALENGNADMAKHWREAAGLGLDETDKALVELEMSPWAAMPRNLVLGG